jgi:hypothetical protein
MAPKPKMASPGSNPKMRFSISFYLQITRNKYDERFWQL